MSHRDIKHPRAGGAERTIYEVGRRLVAMGHDFVWSSVSWSNEISEDVIDGIKILRNKNNVVAHLSVPGIIRGIRPNAIVDDMGHAVPWGSENFTKTVGTVFFHHLHRRSLGGQVSNFYKQTISSLEALYPFIYRKWTFVTESESSLLDLISLGITRERIVQIPPGVDTKAFKPSEKTSTPTLIYFGGFREYKRPWEVLYILPELLKSKRNLSLIMVGTGPSLSKTKEISINLGISDHVRFVGRLTDQELQEIVSRSWINIHTSVTEGVGFSILEASSAGTPTVAYSVPGVRDFIMPGKNGSLVTNGDREAFKEEILRICESDEKRWTETSRNVAMEYSWDRSSAKWVTHLNSIVYH